MTRVESRALALCLMAATLLLTSCSLIGEDDPSGSSTTEVVLLTHDSFVISDELIAQFEQESGFDLTIKASGDAGALTNKLVLTKDNPTGDVVFGIDNTFGSRAIDGGVLAAYSAALPTGAEQFLLAGDDQQLLTPIDNGNVCVNIDTSWFADNDLAPPTGFDDLADAAYADLFVTPGAPTSSPGLAFLLATIAEYGDAWPDYWTRLVGNGVKLTEGWTDAYQVNFTQGGAKGKRPIVTSYDSSPAFTVDGEGGTATAALSDTCFLQIEYAGVLAGAANPTGAQALIDFMLASDFQAALPDAMYVFPVDSAAPLPDDWASFAIRPEEPLALDPAEIAANRDDWLREWTDIVSR